MTNITILTQTDCASCVQAKDVLSRLALEYPVQVREVGLDTEDGRELAARHGVVFAPGILLDGDTCSAINGCQRRNSATTCPTATQPPQPGT